MGIKLKLGKMHSWHITMRNSDYGLFSKELDRVFEDVKYGKATEFPSWNVWKNQIRRPYKRNSTDCGYSKSWGNLAYRLDIIAKDISFEMQIKGIFAEIKFIHTDLYFYSYFGSGNQSDNADGRFNSYGWCNIIKHVNVNLFSVFPDDSDVYGSVH